MIFNYPTYSQWLYELQRYLSNADADLHDAWNKLDGNKKDTARSIVEASHKIRFVCRQLFEIQQDFDGDKRLDRNGHWSAEGQK